MSRWETVIDPTSSRLPRRFFALLGTSWCRFAGNMSDTTYVCGGNADIHSVNSLTFLAACPARVRPDASMGW